MFNLRITDRTHLLLKDYIEPGDVCIDATLGNGNDAYFLYQCAGENGVIFGMDIQEEAIRASRKLFQEKGNTENVHLIKMSHVNIKELFLPKAPKVIVFNLGYLPASNKELTTSKDDTLIALEKSLELLQAGGVLSIVTYPGHEEGKREHESVLNWLKSLPSKTYEVLTITQTNRSIKTPVQHMIYKG